MHFRRVARALSAGAGERGRRAAMVDYTLIKALHVASVLTWFGGVVLNGVVLGGAARTARRPVARPGAEGARLGPLGQQPGPGAGVDFRHLDGRRWRLDLFRLGFPTAGSSPSSRSSSSSRLHGSAVGGPAQARQGAPAERRLRLVRYSAAMALACGLAIAAAGGAQAVLARRRSAVLPARLDSAPRWSASRDPMRGSALYPM